MSKEKQTYHHGDMPKALMNAALVRIKNDGVEKLSLRAIARDIGVSQTAPYRHFKDKETLLAHLACEGFIALSEHESAFLQQYSTHVDNQGNTSAEYVEELIYIGLLYVDFAIKHPQHYQLMFGTKICCREDYQELIDAGHTAFNIIVSKVEEGVKAGLLMDMEPLTLAKSLWSSCHGLASLVIAGVIDRTEEELLEFLKMQMFIASRGVFKNHQALNNFKL